jgi:hypothetical protein
MPDNIRSSLQSLTVGLYYPSILGTGFFILALRLVKEIVGDPSRNTGDAPYGTTIVSLLLTLVIIAYFSISYLMIVKIEENRYDTWFFILDSFEALFILGIFVSLGAIDPNTWDTNFHVFYFCLFGVVIEQSIWNCYSRIRKCFTNPPPPPCLMIAGGLLVSFGGIFSVYEGWGWFNWLTLAFLTWATISYAIRVNKIRC